MPHSGGALGPRRNTGIGFGALARSSSLAILRRPLVTPPVEIAGM
jgi:hypothetical protein